MRYLKLLIIFCLSYISCSDENPECIDEMIENFKQNQEGCTNANIIKYEFRGEEVYALLMDNASAMGVQLYGI